MTIPRQAPAAAALPDPVGGSGWILVGPPNVGKSALFGSLTRSYVTVSNYPGTTVEIVRARSSGVGPNVEIIDTPGIRNLVPSSEDERVTRDMLLDNPPEAVLLVGDAKNLDRVLALALQLGEMELPFVLCLNMADEARHKGISVDTERLSEILGVAVVSTVAVEHKGVPQLRAAMENPRSARWHPRYAPVLESATTSVASRIPAAPVAARAIALQILCGDETLIGWVRERVPAAELAEIEDIRQRLRRSFPQTVLYSVNQTRLRAARNLAARVTRRSSLETRSKRTAVMAWLDRAALHPLWSIPLLAAVLYAAYWFVGVFGAGTLVGLLEEGLFGTWINPGAEKLVRATIPWPFLQDLLVGPYGIITMALTYALALILPIVGTFFLAFGVLEDSGYLPRLAVMLDRVFRKMGLNGKAVLPMVLGLGCDTMATLTTRILETRKERLIVIILLSLAVPCSAQLTVILALLGSLSTLALLVWLTVIIGVILFVGSIASWVLPGKTGDFVIELPPMRVPRLSNILIKTLARIEWYLKEAVPLFVLGTVILFLIDRLGALGMLRTAGEPVVRDLLGLPRETAEIFLIGFLRRDFGAAGLYQMAERGDLDPVQVVVAAVTVTLFVPCIAQFFMTIKERGWRTGVAVFVFVITFALAVGAGLSRLLNAIDLPLG